MLVTRLRLRDFRSYASADVVLGERLTVVHGPNGAGKTNLLEGLYFGCTGRSCRTTSEREVVRFDAGAARVEVGGMVLSSRLIEGQFPNYRQLLPETYEHELRLETRELTDVVRRIALLAQKNAPLRLNFTEGEVRVSAQTPDVGEASEPLPVPFAGEPIEIGFNPDFLTVGLESAGAEQVSLKLNSPLLPALIESADGRGFLYLIKPIRLNV